MKYTNLILNIFIKLIILILFILFSFYKKGKLSDNSDLKLSETIKIKILESDSQSSILLKLKSLSDLGIVIQSASSAASSFQTLSTDYGKDKNKVYYNDIVVEKSDPKTFQKLYGPYSKDKNRVHISGKVLKEA